MNPCTTHDWFTHGTPVMKSCRTCGKVWSAPLPTYGKQSFAPCGHEGTHVTANYVTCNKGCDAIPEPVEPEITKPTEYDGDDGDVDASWHPSLPWRNNP